MYVYEVWFFGCTLLTFFYNYGQRPYADLEKRGVHPGGETKLKNVPPKVHKHPGHQQTEPTVLRDGHRAPLAGKQLSQPRSPHANLIKYFTIEVQKNQKAFTIM